MRANEFRSCPGSVEPAVWLRPDADRRSGLGTGHRQRCGHVRGTTLVTAVIDAATAVFEAAATGGTIVVITGAGVSVESGIRPYRGAGGRWTAGGRERDEEGDCRILRPPSRGELGLASRSTVRSARGRTEPGTRRNQPSSRDRSVNGSRSSHRTSTGSTCEQAVPQSGLLSCMVTSTACGAAVGATALLPVPDGIHEWEPGDSIGEKHFEILVCPNCGLVTRPHVLWFDEFYDEEHYRIGTAQRAVAKASVCITVGTSGGVPIAERLAGIAVKAGAMLIDVNPHDNELRQLALHSGGIAVHKAASAAMPQIAEIADEARVHGEAGKE